MTLSPTELFYMAIGLLTVGAAIAANRHLFRSNGRTGSMNAIEAACYGLALVALLIGWYFNLQYLREYGSQAGWWHWTTLLFVNPASASGGQDLIIANLFLFPLWTIVDARRSGLRRGWLFFAMSLVTSYAFGFALYLAFRERQERWNRR